MKKELKMEPIIKNAKVREELTVLITKYQRYKSDVGRGLHIRQYTAFKGGIEEMPKKDLEDYALFMEWVIGEIDNLVRPRMSGD
jgi:hypothetical protein